MDVAVQFCIAIAAVAAVRAAAVVSPPRHCKLAPARQAGAGWAASRLGSGVPSWARCAATPTA